MRPDPRLRGAGADVPIRRVAITRPPDHWSHGIDLALHRCYRQALVDLGLDVLEVPVEPFLVRDPARISQIVEAARVFRPDLAFGSPKGFYALICRLSPRRKGWRPNLFLDELEVPTICYWDHAPLELADQLLAPLPEDPAHSTAGALDTLGESLRHPLLVHWSRDEGQTRIMRELGWLGSGHVIHDMPSALPGFERRRTSEAFTDAPSPVAFVGHVYQHALDGWSPEIAAVGESAIASWMARGGALWDEVMTHLDALPAETRRRLALDPDQTYFWRFVHRLILHRAQTVARLATLSRAGVPVACYGNVQPELAGTPKNLVPIPGHIPFGPALADMLARHPIVVDVLNPGSILGYSHKPIMGFTAGGFVLVNRKPHFIEAFGDAGEAVSYGTVDELAGKVDLFLTCSSYRHEVGDAIRATIADRFELPQVLARVLREAARVDRVEPRRRTGSAIVVRDDLLPALRAESCCDASVVPGPDGTLVTTCAENWAFAGHLDLPDVRGLHEPHLRITLCVEAGRVGLAVAREVNAIFQEGMLDASADTTTVTLELPLEEGLVLIVRNAREGRSRARLLDAAVCDRPPMPAS